MTALPEPGTPVVVVLRSPEPVQWQGVLVALRDASLAIRVTNPPAAWNSMLPYSVICGVPGSRFMAPANFVAHNGSVAAFKITTRWKPLDLRKAPRFSTDLSCEVRSVLGSSRQTGRIIDISAGGAAVALDAKPGGSQVEIGIWANGYGAHMLCDVVGSSVVGEDTILRLRFAEMSAPQAAFVRQLVGQLLEAESEAS